MERPGKLQAVRVRECPACLSRSRRPAGLAGGFSLFRCSSCHTLYTGTILGSAAEALDYSRYYHEGNLAVPPFVERRLGEVVGDFEKYRRATCGSTPVVARVL